MGLTLTNKNKDFNIGYISFGIMRKEIAKAFDTKTGEMYERLLMMKYPTKGENEYLDRVLPKYLDLFLFHSDCDGKLSANEVKGIYKELSKLKVVFENENLEKKYNEMLELFKEGITLHFY